MRRRAFSHILVFAFLLGAHVYTTVVVHAPHWRLVDPDEFYYINAALLILDGSYFTSMQTVEIVPLYPLWLNMLMHIDPTFADYLERLVDNWHTTGPEKEITSDFGHQNNLGLYAQAVLGAVGVGFSWLAGWLASGRFLVAHLSALVALLVDDYAFYNTEFLTENLIIPLFAGVNVCLAWLARGGATMQRTAVVAVGCGLMLGALILTRPPYEYLLAALLFAAVAWMLWHRSRRRETAVATVCILIGAALVVTPWIARNYTIRGFVGLTEAYAPAILAQRINYNAMTREQWAAAWLVWSLGKGRVLATDAFGPETVAPLIYWHPEYFERQRRGHELLTGVALKDQVGVLMAHIWSDLPRHLAVSVPLAWRGMNKFRPSTWLFGITPIWGVVLLLAIFVSLARGTHRSRIVLLALTFSPLVILAIHALVSSNVPRYNIGLVTPLSVAVALSIAWATDGTRNKLGRWIPWIGPRRSNRAMHSCDDPP